MTMLFAPGTSNVGKRLDQQQSLHARVALAADDDVVAHGDAEGLGRIDDLLCHLDVGAQAQNDAKRSSAGAVWRPFSKPRAHLITGFSTNRNDR